MSINGFLKLARSFPEVLNQDVLIKLSTFLLYAPRFKNDILLAQASNWPTTDPPMFLPQSILHLLSNLCEIDTESIHTLWSYLKETVWGYNEKAKAVDERFKLFGKDLGYRSLYPPVNYCTDSLCDRPKKDLKLQKADQTQGVLYTLDGVRPVWVIRFQCEGCQTAYYHNYSVKNGMRNYYDGAIPEIIQVGEHQFVELKVLHMWRADTNISWKSFTNCARTYEVALAGPGSNGLPSNWKFQAALKGDHIQDGFTILSLLEDHRERISTLIVPHTGEQTDRFTQAIKARNARIKLYGQKEISHRCKKCTRIYAAKDGEPALFVWVAVMDGITLGHNCCAVHNCQIPLTTSRDRYCAIHRNLSSICAIKECNRPVLEGKRTCQHPDHREVERMYILRGQSRVQLQDKLKRQRVSHLNDGIAEEIEVGELIDGDVEEEEFEVDEQDPNLVHGVNDGVSDPRGASPPLTGGLTKKRISAQFGRRRTHNEQILVAPCGMILARETFYGAEAIATCAEFVKRTFSINHQKPNHLFFDNNCSLSKHVKGDPFFKDMGLTVDVFHFNCKHSVKDKYCQSNCNPVDYAELLDENGKGWYFNSSIAEQTNVWLGGFHSILREMRVDRYNFFLDTMILLRNAMTRDKLQKDGHFITETGYVC
ncbi:uncharacterized protein LACBIDRAFT_308276 [Laccaria bicolor S238N-H82]|uniref:Predicted protein n=1 Tax=Laccaria bicolor (strain S238N-H82 / ATCC MYA-4686) TaxID=486041 RepID=B0DRZ7_LACBS|nr:uncharacterized protein LACBIDRAFT_308276 [Laccaria bicolor S238N-H82]EDR02614.1 predicted protein [Laccaria bicolor S238N-H82]|eukprot:XP_001886658.1 predicted protein [Laccaria bicolor S238N-H82]